MAAKKNKHATTQVTKTSVGDHTAKRNVSAGISSEMNPSTHWLIMSGLAMVTFFCLRGSLGNLFTNWDDPGYIQDNPVIKHISPDGLKAIFSTPVMGNYHPLTILSYAIEYALVQFDPWLYHFDNLILHVADTLLVYWLAYILSRRYIAAVITALLFGIHPMHVESVAWISGRKDVLYALFYLSACICYVYRVRSGKFSITVPLLFLCALLAKPVATTLPVSLLLIDYLEKRPLNVKLIVEKLHLFLISVVFGIIALRVQHSAGAMDMQKEHFNALERIALGGYSFITYLWKALLPIKLSNYYPYPPRPGNALSSVYYLYPVSALIILFLLWRFFRRNITVIFGTLFFIANIALLLQFIQVGDAIFAERYSYIPYLGLFYITGVSISGFFEDGKRPYANMVIGSFILYAGILFFMSSERTKVWYDPISLWTDAIEKDPVNDVGAYNNLGYIYYQKWAAEPDVMEKQKYFDSGLYLLKKAIELKPAFPNPYVSLGEMLRGSGRYSEAKDMYLSGLKYDKKNPNMHLGLALLYYFMKDTVSAGVWFRAAIIADPSPQAYGNYANFLNITGKPDSALLEYATAIRMAPDMYANYLNRGRVLLSMNKPADAITDLNKALQIDPDLGEIYYERAQCYHKLADKQHAVADLDKAIALGYKKIDDNFYREVKQSP